MRWAFHALLAAVGLSMAGDAAARTEKVMSRDTPWVLRYDDKACDMAATFTHGDARITATITAFSPFTGLQLTLAGDGMDWPFPLAEARMGAGANPRLDKVEVLSALGAKQVPMMIVMFTHLDDGMDAAGNGAIDQITFVAPSGKSYRLQTGNLRDPKRVLMQCAQRLEQEWGYLPWEQEKLASRPKALAPASAWLRPSDYPERAEASGTSGYLRLRVDVSAEGAVTGCKVLRSIGPDSFGEAACRALSQRGSFAPARDAQGNAVKSYTIFSALFGQRATVTAFSMDRS